MATMTQYFDVHTNHGNLNPSWLICVRGRFVPDWVWRISKPVPAGFEIPHDRPIFTVDPAEEMREQVAMIPKPPKPALRKEAVKKRYGFSVDSQLEEAISKLGFPVGVVKTKTDGAFLGWTELDKWQEWTDEELTRYDESLFRVFPALKR